MQLNVAKSPTTNVPININNPCLVVPPSACIEEARYITTVTLPPKVGGYDIVYQRCCRNPSTQNILNPNSQGSSYLAHIPEDPLEAENSSPRFLNYPPTVLCSLNPFTFDHSATDADGDQLVYELCTPFDGGTPNNPAPNPSPPPFSTVTWNLGFNNNMQIVGNPTLSIDPVTGELSGNPTVNGIYTFGVCVKEYRNGILLSESRRDFQFWVTNCDPLLLAGIPAQTDSCAGFTINFTNNSVGSSFYEWDFGDGNTSTQVNPTHTYAAQGNYTIQLIANPGWPCADTAITTYQVKEPLSVDFVRPNAQCVTTNNYSFQANSNHTGSANFFWDFGTNATPSSSNFQNPNNIIFGDSGKYVVSVLVDEDGCTANYSDTIYVIPEPIIDFDFPAQEGCQVYEASFTDGSYSWTPLNYFWHFGNGDTSTMANPTTYYTDTGYYDVTLSIFSDSGCTTTKTLAMDDLIHVLPSPTSQFSISPEETDVFEPFFFITDQSYGGVVDLFYLDSKNDTILPGNGGQHIVDDTGWVNVQQWVYNEHGCPDSSTQLIYIKPITTVYAPNAFTPDGDGKNDLWKPIVRDVYDYQVFVFTRWGELIFYSEDQEAGWNGTFKGKQSPSDVYVYKLRYRAMNKIQQEKIGHVTLVR